MPQQFQERSTRNGSRGRLQQRAPSTAAPNASNKGSSAQTSLIPARLQSLPPGDKQKTGTASKTKIPAMKKKAPSNQQVTTSEAASSNISGEVLSKVDSNNTAAPSPKEVDGGGVSDNTGYDLPPFDDKKLQKADTHAETLRLVLAEIQEIKSQMLELKNIKNQVSKLDIIEASTTTLAKDLADVIGRTAGLETAVSSNTTSLKEVNNEIVTVKKAIGKQEKSLSNLSAWKEGIIKSNSQTVSKMNDLVKTQQRQVDTFRDQTDHFKKELLAEMDKRQADSQRDNETQIKNDLRKELLAELNQTMQESMQSQNDSLQVKTKNIKQDILTEVDNKAGEIKRDLRSQALKDQAYKNRANVGVVGLEESDEKSPLELVQDHFSNALKVKDVEIKKAYRIGAQPDAGSSYCRPIVVRFLNLDNRNKVWREKTDITTEDGKRMIRIQADLPKPLREGMQAMYRVLKAAEKIKEFETAKINNYQLELNDKVYQVSDLEKLPFRIRPSTLSSPRSDTTMVFFSRHSFLSNHHMSTFKIGNFTYHSMEQFLAVKKATFARKQALLKKALKVKDPVQAKHVLNSLRDDRVEDWAAEVPTVAMEGLRAKFAQNRSLKDKLCKTFPLTLGEASKNPRWGIGMDISDHEALDQGKWIESGNLLGRSLMEVRQEFLNDNIHSNA